MSRLASSGRPPWHPALFFPAFPSLLSSFPAFPSPLPYPLWEDHSFDCVTHGGYGVHPPSHRDHFDYLPSDRALNTIASAVDRVVGLLAQSLAYERACRAPYVPHNGDLLNELEEEAVTRYIGFRSALTHFFLSQPGDCDLDALLCDGAKTYAANACRLLFARYMESVDGSVRDACGDSEDEQRAATGFLRHHARRADDLLYTSFLATILRFFHLTVIVELRVGDESSQLSYEPLTRTLGGAPDADLPMGDAAGDDRDSFDIGGPHDDAFDDDDYDDYDDFCDDGDYF